MKLEEMRKSEQSIRFKYQQSEKKNIMLTAEISQAKYVTEKLEREHEKNIKRI